DSPSTLFRAYPFHGSRNLLVDSRLLMESIVYTHTVGIKRFLNVVEVTTAGYGFYCW
ncbi:hypothetical protein Tco_1415799, partial [Tanacetum coccineum]